MTRAVNCVSFSVRKEPQNAQQNQPRAGPLLLPLRKRGSRNAAMHVDSRPPPNQSAQQDELHAGPLRHAAKAQVQERRPARELPPSTGPGIAHRLRAGMT
jgi:hypothetical protein